MFNHMSYHKKRYEKTKPIITMETKSLEWELDKKRNNAYITDALREYTLQLHLALKFCQ